MLPILCYLHLIALVRSPVHPRSLVLSLSSSNKLISLDHGAYYLLRSSLRSPASSPAFSPASSPCRRVKWGLPRAAGDGP